MTTAAAAPAQAADTTASVTSVADTTTAASATATQGQATSQDGTSQSDKATTAPAQEDTFFDPKEVPDELKPAYKQMQAAFTKKMQVISKDRDAISAYRNFEKDPIGNMQAMAQRMGYTLTRAEAAAQLSTQGAAPAQEFQPQSWDEVANWMKAQIMPHIQQQFQPLVDNVQKVTAHNIEQQLDTIDPNWRMYEDDMKANIQEHPSLVKDIGKLYRLSVPEEVLNSRATQAALRKLESKGQAASVHGRSSAAKALPTAKKATSFQEAVELAKAAQATR